MLRNLTITLILFPVFLIAQNKPVYLSFEGGGSGIIASGNIGKAVIIRPRYKIIFQTGLGWPPPTAESRSPFSIPAQLTCNFGDEGLFFEAGLGATLLTKCNLGFDDPAKRINRFYLSPIVGFRHETTIWFARLFACPLYYITGESLTDEITGESIKIGVAIGVIL